MTLCIIIEPSSYTETYVGSVMKTVIVNRSGRSIRRSLSAVRKPCLEDHQLAHGGVMSGLVEGVEGVEGVVEWWEW